MALTGSANEFVSSQPVFVKVVKICLEHYVRKDTAKAKCIVGVNAEMTDLTKLKMGQTDFFTWVTDFSIKQRL